MVDSVVPSSAPENSATRSRLPWVLLAVFLVWLGALAWMARGEFKARPKHERERSAPSQERGQL